jgi:hypothetical protein
MMTPENEIWWIILCTKLTHQQEAVSVYIESSHSKSPK